MDVYLFKIHSSCYKKASRFIWQLRPDRPGQAWAGQSRFPQSQSKRGLLDTPSSSFRHRTVALGRKNNYGNKNTARESEDAGSIPGQKTKTAETQNRENTVLAVSRTRARSHREKLIRVKFASRDFLSYWGQFYKDYSELKCKFTLFTCFDTLTTMYNNPFFIPHLALISVFAYRWRG